MNIIVNNGQANCCQNLLKSIEKIISYSRFKYQDRHRENIGDKFSGGCIDLFLVALTGNRNNGFNDGTRFRHLSTFEDRLANRVFNITDSQKLNTDAEKKEFFEDYFKNMWSIAVNKSSDICHLTDGLDQAVEENDDEFVELLLHAGVPANAHHIVYYAKCGNLKMLDLCTKIAFTKKNFNKGCKCERNIVPNNELLSHIASAVDSLNQLDCLKHLLPLRDPDDQSKPWFLITTTAVSKASNQGKIEFVKEFLRANVPLDKFLMTKDLFSMWGSFDDARKKAYLECMEVLARAGCIELNNAISRGASVGAVDFIKLSLNLGGTVSENAIDNAVVYDDADTLKLLLAQPQAKVSMTSRVVFRAAELGRLKYLQLFLQAGASIDSTLVEAAEKNNHHDCAQLVRSALKIKELELAIIAKEKAAQDANKTVICVILVFVIIYIWNSFQKEADR